MLDHHLQKAIVYQLAFTPQARFSELKPDDIESKLFTYHLQKVVAAGYVAKTDDGLYQLTPHGRRLGLEALKSERNLLDNAYSLLLLVVRRNDDGAWLLSTRQRQPLHGYVGLPQARPSVGVDTVTTSAQSALRTKTGLDGTFSVLGSGFLRIFKDDELESFTNFTLLVCEDATGELTVNDKKASYKWMINPDFTDEKMLPNVAMLIDLYEKGKPFFVDKTYKL